MKVAINGFGRIGKQFLIACLEKQVKWEFIINDITSPEYLVYSLKYDSVHPSFPETVTTDGKFLYVGKKKIKILNELDATKLPWKAEKVDVVVDCTGLFTKAEEAIKHVHAGAKRVLISAPGKGHDVTIVYGVNSSALKKEHTIISAGSCTTNCVSPVLKVLHDAWKIQSAHFITTHAYTATQKLIDGFGKKDFRGGRSAAINIIPSTSGASISVVESIPDLKGKLEGYALRVPVADGSITSIVARVGKKVTVEEVNAQFKKQTAGALKGVLGYTDEPIVSGDIIHNSNSSIFDAGLTKVVDDLVSVGSWYDNEWGYSCRLVDVAKLIEKLS